MLTIRKANDRGAENLGWLHSRHTFSFGEYYDSRHMGFGPLRVINEDRVQPGRGFGTHGHRDMEIISYVVEGALAHKDSIGTGSVIRPGDVQIMSAGTGIQHSEFNHSKSEALHFLQIWVTPDRLGISPRYDQRHFSDEEKRGVLRLVGSAGGRGGSVVVHQDLDLFATILYPGEKVAHVLTPGRKGWLQVVRGSATLNGQALQEGDGAAAEEESVLDLESTHDKSEFLLFDLP